VGIFHDAISAKRYILIRQPNTDIFLTINRLLTMALLINKYEEWGYTAEKKLAFASLMPVS
jgi:hypothetical protein